MKKESINPTYENPVVCFPRPVRGEMGNVNKATRLIRSVTCLPPLELPKDHRWFPELLRLMELKVLPTDMTNPLGSRNVMDGNLELLTGFEYYNAYFPYRLDLNVFIKYTSSINRETGTFQLFVPPFIPNEQIRSHKPITHFQFIARGAAINFRDLTAIENTDSTDLMPLSAAKTAPFTLIMQLPPDSKEPLFLILGVAFYLQHEKGFELKAKMVEINKISNSPK